MPRAPKLLRVEEAEALPGPGTLSWIPIRHLLGIRAFGCNAYVADEVGQEVVEPHTEEVVEPHTEDPKLAHEELYFVARGAATFTIDGEAYKASAGTYVFVPDPASHRQATALEPGTIVLSFGGPPVFVPSAWEWAFRAAAIQQVDPGGAREILRDGLTVHAESAALHYGLACVEALDGRTDEALGSLRNAIDLRSEVRDWAREDSDFDNIRGDERFSSLLAG